MMTWQIKRFYLMRRMVVDKEWHVILIEPTLATTLEPLVMATGGDIRRTIESIGRSGVRAVQLSATLRGVRARDLDAGGRRDFASTISRAGLMVAGIDVMIPANDWARSDRLDQVMAAVFDHMALAKALGGGVISLTLPIDQIESSVLHELLTAADGHGVRLAIHAEEMVDPLSAWLTAIDQPFIGAAIDPAQLLALEHDPMAVASQLASLLIVSRLNDYAGRRVGNASGQVSGKISKGTSGEYSGEISGGVSGGGGMCVVGEGLLDMTAYRVGLSMAPRLTSVVIDLRGLIDPWAGLTAAQRLWAST